MTMTTGAIRRAKLQSNHHHQQTNPSFLQAGCPSSRSTNSVKALKKYRRRNHRQTKKQYDEIETKRAFHFKASLFVMACLC